MFSFTPVDKLVLSWSIITGKKQTKKNITEMRVEYKELFTVLKTVIMSCQIQKYFTRGFQMLGILWCHLG